MNNNLTKEKPIMPPTLKKFNVSTFLCINIYIYIFYKLSYLRNQIYSYLKTTLQTTYGIQEKNTTVNRFNLINSSYNRSPVKYNARKLFNKLPETSRKEKKF